MNCTWIKIDGRYICKAKKCKHWLEGGGCELGKSSVTCDNIDCKWNKQIAPGVYGCISMDIHLDANGKCYGIRRKNKS